MADTPPRRRQRTPRVKLEDAEAATESPKFAPDPEPAPIKAPGKGPVNLQRKLETMVAAMGLPFAAAGDQHCAQVFAQRAPVVAEAWANLAAESPAVKRALESMLKGGAWTGAIGATAGLLIPVAAHHGLTPEVPNIFGARKHEPEPDLSTPQTNGNNGFHSPPAPNGGAPGPAAVSVKPINGDGPDLTDPSVYPGNVLPDS